MIGYYIIMFLLCLMAMPVLGIILYTMSRMIGAGWFRSKQQYERHQYDRDP